MNFFVGTSGYSYKEWKGPFYPEKMKPAEMLAFYAQHFNTVEINNTFYRMPKTEVLAQWAAQVPPEFSFVLKAPQRITHFQRLKVVDDSLDFFFNNAATLGARLGPILLQLPPTLKKDVSRLRDFFAALPQMPRLAIEFRHASWFDDEVFDLLGAANAALVASEMDDADAPELRSTADWGYLRLRRAEYTEADLRAWLTRIQQHKWSDVFIFFKHEDDARGPQFAKQFLDLARN